VCCYFAEWGGPTMKLSITKLLAVRSLVQSGLPVAAFLIALFLGLPAPAQEKRDAGKPAAEKQVRPGKFTPAQQEPSEEQKAKKSTAGPEHEDAEQVKKREMWFYKQRVYPLPSLPANARFAAFQHMQRMMEAEGKIVRLPNGGFAAANATVTLGSPWTSIGPTPTTGGFFSPVTGRITTIAVDPADSSGNTVLIGGAQGGIWRTIDGGTTWAAVGDANPSLAMGSIAFAPSSPATVYAGTGEQASTGFDVYYGAGILKSTNGGQTWAPTCPSGAVGCNNPFLGPFSNGFFPGGGARISYLSVNPANANLILAGVQIFTGTNAAGVYCSNDGGLNWMNILAGQMATFVGFANATTAFVALGRPFGSASGGGQSNANGIYKSTAANGACSAFAFTRVAGAGLPAQASIGRIDLGIAPLDTTGNTVYASIANAADASSTNLGVFKTGDGGLNWTNTNAPDVCRQQCWYDNVVKVDPANSDTAFFGGAFAFTAAGAPNWVVRRLNGAAWASVIPNALGPGLPHADNHAMAFVRLTNGKVRMYLGNDGGIWRTDDAEAPTVVWTNLNTGGLTLTQFYPNLSIHPSNPTISFAGAQDNGSQNYQGGTSWVDNKTCGDGGQTTLDPNVPSSVYVTCQDIDINFSPSNGVPGSFSFVTNGINPADNGSFIPPINIDPTTSRVYFGTDKVYQTSDNGASWIPLMTASLGSTGAVIDTVAVAPKNPAVVYAGYEDGTVIVSTNVGAGTGTFVKVAGLLPVRAVTQVVPDPNDATGQTVYVTLSGFAFGGDLKGHIFKSTNAGGTWTDVSCAATTVNCQSPAITDLPNIPVNDLVVDPDITSPQTLYAATDLGVFTSSDGGATWGTLATGLPNVAVLSLRLHEPSRTLRAATHGRGAWDLNLTNFAFVGAHLATINPASTTAPGAAFTMTLAGSGFIATTNVLWDGAQNGITPHAGTATQMTADIPPALLTSAGTHQIKVQDGLNPASNSLIFTVLGGAPTLALINPASTPVQPPAPAANVPITLTGTGFTTTSKVQWNGATNGITVSAPTGPCPIPTCLTATLPAALLGPFGSTNDITVLNSPPGGGSSAAQAFKVVAAAPANDSFANAINITTSTFNDTKDSSGATTETNDPTPACSQAAGLPVTGRDNTIWYKFTPASNGNLNVDTVGSNYDSVLSLWTGATQATLTAVPGGCNDDINPGIVTVSRITGLPLTGGTTYFIMVSSFGAADPNPLAFGGKSVLNFSFTATPDFTLTVSGANSATVNAGSPASYTLAIAAVAGFNSSINFTCSLPAAHTTCAVTPPSQTAGNNITVNVTTTARNFLPPVGNFRRIGPWFRTVPLLLVTLILFALFIRFARTRKMRLAYVLPLAALFLLLAFQAGCGGGSSGPPVQNGTLAGTYTVTVTGTSGATTHSTNLMLIVN
jgi:hypothetical protein